MSFDYLKDHLSPETVEKYGPTDREPKPSIPPSSSAAAEPSSTTEVPRPTQEEAETGPSGGAGDGGEELGRTEDASESANPDKQKEFEGVEENAINDIDATASS